MTKVGDDVQANLGQWTFEGAVADQFDAHVAKSVPGYHEGHKLISSLANFFVSPASSVYEIGCSTGSLLLDVVEQTSFRADVRYYGIDTSESMLRLARDKAQARNLNEENGISLEFLRQDATAADYEKSSLFICYYTVQFIHPSLRQMFITKLYESLNWGGALIMFEKVRGSDARFQDILNSIYWDFKKANGYTSDEIMGKSESLRGVLEPFSEAGNLGLLQRAGFSDIETVYKNMCFQGFLAIK